MDYYEILGVDRDADARTIKRAFLKKARELHPDVNKADDAEERFKLVNEAYSVLSDERKRANYDQFGNPDGPQGFGGGDYVDMSDIFGGMDMSDIFSSFFGGGGGRSRGRQARTAGRDMGINLRITLAEAASGTTKTISYDRLAPCDDCAGRGFAEGGSVTTCSRCHGTGTVVTVQNTMLGRMQTQSVCPDCQGTGRMVDHPCETCQGQGRTPSHETVKIEIPAGIHSGQNVTVRGRGEAGVRGDRSGDLVVSVTITDDDRFRRQGDDLICTVEVDALEAMVGSAHVIDGILEGECVRVEVPAGCQYGQQVVVNGHGMPRQGTSARGNLIVLIDVRVPTDLTPEQVELVEDMVRERADLERLESVAEKDAPRTDDVASKRKKKRPRKGGR